MTVESKIILETERLILRQWKLEDANDLFEICRNPEVMLHIGNRKPFENIDDAVKFLNWAITYENENGFCRWAVIEKSSGKIVGSCGFARRAMDDVELGYLFAREIWGNGYATEAAKACTRYGFEKLKFTKIIALTDVEHSASQKVLKKSGFIERGIVKSGGEKDMVYEAINAPLSS